MDGQSVSKQTRVEHIDLFRAFGIILMIMGHIRFGSGFDKWIHGFHMPMFFFISGWFYKSRSELSAGRLLAKKIRGLLLPYLVFEIVQWLILMPFIPEYRNLHTLRYIFTENTYKIPVENGTFGISPVPGAMWFLTAIFFAEILYIFLDRVFRRRWMLHTAVLLTVSIGMLAPRALPFRLPWALDAALTGVGFFHVGKTVRGTKMEKCLDLRLWQALLTCLAFSALIVLCPKINMRTGNYGLYLPFWINALGAIAGGWSLSRHVEFFLARGKKRKLVSRWLREIGKNSIVYLCLNQTVILAVTKVLDMAGVNGLIAKLPVLALTMAVLFGLEKWISDTKLKVIIGK